MLEKCDLWDTAFPGDLTARQAQQAQTHRPLIRCNSMYCALLTAATAVPAICSCHMIMMSKKLLAGIVCSDCESSDEGVKCVDHVTERCLLFHKLLCCLAWLSADAFKWAHEADPDAQ
jgi:hypothetical protein